MRKVVRKQLPIPQTLCDDAARFWREELTKYYQMPVDQRSRRRPPLNSELWSSSSVRDNLSSVFLSKCAYCEMPLMHSSIDVSHHRPTGNAIGIRSRKFDSASPDHYSWFAYEWENLFLTCAECNRSKRNLFPLNGPRARLRCTWKEAEMSEQTLIINPCNTEPRKHLKFCIDGEVVGKNEIGNTTVEVLSLNRPNLIKERARKFQQCLDFLETGRYNHETYDEFRRELHDNSPYCGAARILFFNLFSKFSATLGVTKPSFRTLIDDVVRISLAARDDQWKQLLNLVAPVPLSQNVFYETSQTQLGARDLRHITKPRASLLRRISIRNFKGISTLDLDIPPAHFSDSGAPCIMLLGENSTGKSTTLQAIALALMDHKMRDIINISAEDFLPREVYGWQLDDTVSPEVILEFDTGEPIKLQIDPMTKQFIGDEQSSIILFAFGSRRFFGKDIIRRQPAATLKSLFDPFARLQHPGRWLQGLSSNDFNSVARAMREVLVLQEEDNIDRDQEGRLFIRAHGRDSPLEQLSDGYRSLMGMVLNIMRGMLEEWGDLENAHGLVLVDEIENHLHPRWKLRVMSALRRAMPNVQFIATTHDPLCLRGMRDEEVHVLMRNDEKHIQTLTGLPDVRGLRAEQLLTSDYFGLSSTADPDIEGALRRLALSADANAVPSQIDQATVQLFQWIGDTPVEQIVNEALRRFIEESEDTTNIDRSKVRETAVNNVLKGLRALRARR